MWLVFRILGCEFLLLLQSHIFLANNQNLVAPKIYTQSCHFDEGEILARSSAKKIMFVFL